MKKLILLATLLISFTVTSFADHGPRIQFINNSAADFMQSVDVWVGFELAVNFSPPTKFIEGLNYKEAFEYTTFSLIYGDLVFYITPAGSVDTTNLLLKKSFGQPEIDYEETHVIVLSEDSNGNLDMILTDGQETSPWNNQATVKVFHGVTDAPAVNIAEVSVPEGVLIENLAYGGSTEGYLDLNALDYDIQIQTTDGIGVAEFSVPLSNFDDTAVFVIATGYLDTTGVVPNRPLKLLAVKPDGTVVEIDPNEGLTDARVQVIHNSADAAASVVDVWLDDILLLNDFSFRSASPFVNAPGAKTFTISIKGPDSTNPDNPIWTQDYILASGKTYVLVAEGIVSSDGYSPSIPFDIAVYDNGRETSTISSKTSVLVHHGSTDAPTVDIYESDSGEIIDDLMYSAFAGYLNLSTQDYILEVRDETGENILAAYEAPLATLELQGSSLVVVASGFLNPDNNSSGPAFGLWVALPTGGPLLELPFFATTAIEDNLIKETSINIYPNPATDLINLNFRLQESANVEVHIADLAGRLVKKDAYGILYKSIHTLNLDISDLNSGMYFLSIRAGNSISTQKLKIIR